MHEFFLTLNQPVVLWTLFTSSVLLVLLDYLLPVDWLAYLGYVCFAVFVGATVSVSPAISLAIMAVVGVGMLIAHAAFFSKYLTNAPGIERGIIDELEQENSSVR